MVIGTFHHRDENEISVFGHLDVIASVFYHAGHLLGFPAYGGHQHTAGLQLPDEGIRYLRGRRRDQDLVERSKSRQSFIAVSVKETGMIAQACEQRL